MGKDYLKFAAYGWNNLADGNPPPPSVSLPLSALPQPVIQLLVPVWTVLFAAARQTG